MRLSRLVVAALMCAPGSLVAFSSTASAVGGESDPTFGAGGSVRIDTRRPSLDSANAASSGPPGHLTVAGAVGDRLAVARFTASGDASAFGGDNVVTADFGVPSVAYGVEAASIGGYRDGALAVGQAGGDLAVAAFDELGVPIKYFGRSGQLVVPLGGLAAGQAVRGGLVAGWIVRDGHRDLLLARLDDSGLKTAFNAGGTKVLDLAPGADDAGFVVYPADSGFYVAGQAGTAAFVARITDGGSLDPTFGTAGTIMLELSAGADVAKAIGYDVGTEQLVIAGQAGTRAFVARMSLDGVLSGPAAGVVVQVDLGGNDDAATGVVVQEGGMVVVSGTRTTPLGTDGAARRITRAGAVDPSFGDAGLLVADFGTASDSVNGLAVRSDSRLVLVGDSTSDMVLVGYSAAGSPDATFGAQGRVVVDAGGPTSEWGEQVIVDSDGRIVAVGGVGGQLVVSRRLADGRPDASFGDDGTFIEEFGSAYPIGAALQPDGRLLVLLQISTPSGGLGRVVRYSVDGRRDPSFDSSYAGAVVMNPARQSSMAVMADGRIVMAGTSLWGDKKGVARFLPDGAPDPAFGVNGFASVQGRLEPWQSGGVGVQSDGKVIFLEQFRDDASALRFDARGLPDDTFAAPSGTGAVITVLPDDRFYISGDQAHYSVVDPLASHQEVTVERFRSNGVHDEAFGSNGRVHYNLGEQESVKGAVADGQFLGVLGTVRHGESEGAFVLRLSPTGRIDDRYGSGGVVEFPGTVLEGAARDVAGRLVVIGTVYGTTETDILIARLQTGLSTVPPSLPFPLPVPPWAPMPLQPIPPAPAPTPPLRSGYWMVSGNGATYAFGDARHHGNAPTTNAVDLEPSPSSAGYWIVDAAGHVFAFGDAGYLGGINGQGLAGDETVTSLSATATGRGYWLFTTKGRVQAFGDATFYGDMTGVKLNGPVLDSVSTPGGLGYYLVASDGGIFAFGNALFHGSMGGRRLNAPVQSLVPKGDGNGYWLVAADGGVFAFDAPFRGSMGGVRLNRSVTGMVRFGNGYLMVGEDGGIFSFSDKAFAGSLGASPPASAIVSVAALA